MGFDHRVVDGKGVQQIVPSLLVSACAQIMINYQLVEGQNWTTQDDWYTEIQGYDSLTGLR